jgi:hypothetical protein
VLLFAIKNKIHWILGRLANVCISHIVAFVREKVGMWSIRSSTNPSSSDIIDTQLPLLLLLPLPRQGKNIKYLGQQTAILLSQNLKCDK